MANSNADEMHIERDQDVVAESERAPKGRRSEAPEPAPDGPKEDEGGTDAPWWHSKLLVSLLTLVGASIAPTTTWINAQQQRATEAERARHAQELQLQQQQHAVRMEFFEKVVGPTIAMTPESRREALRYFKAVLPPGDLRTWADAEYQSLEQLETARRHAEDEHARESAEANAAAASVEAALGELEAVPAQDVKRREALTATIDQQASQAKERAQRAQKAEQTVATIERKLAESVPAPTATKAGLVATASEAAPAAFTSNRAVTASSSRERTELAAAGGAPPTVAADALQVGFDARRTLLTESKSETFYRFSVAIEAPAAVLSRISKVQYLFDHPTFAQKNLVSRDRAAKFEVSYRGWGCLSEVVATITLVDGQTLHRTFDQCATIR